MAQNITLLGASYSAVPAVVLPKTGGGTARFDDASITTATASDVASGKIFLANDGTITTGTSSGGGGSSAWTKVGEATYQVSTTSTSQAVVGTITCSQSIWTTEKIVYVRVRDTVGRRLSYFYGSDTFIINEAITKRLESYSSMGRWIWKGTSSGYSLRQTTASTVYGVAPGRSLSASTPYDIDIVSCYSSSYSATINGTYKVEVYLLDPPAGAPIFT